MLERQPIQIEILGETPSKRDFCLVPLDESVRDNLTCLMILERQLSEGLPAERREGAILAHTFLWNRLPDYYKSELADLTAIYL